MGGVCFLLTVLIFFQAASAFVSLLVELISFGFDVLYYYYYYYFLLQTGFNPVAVVLR
jgi:hypothetical protein